VANPNLILERFKTAKRIRENWENTWQEIFDYTMPGRDNLRVQSRGARRDDLVFDETAVVGVQEFASRMVQGITPNNVKWARLTPAPSIMNNLEPNDAAEIQEELDKATAQVFDVIEASNFQQEAHEAFLDGALGTGSMVIQDGESMEPLNFHAVPISEVYLEAGPFDRIDAQFRVRTPKADDIKILWPKASISSKLADIIHNKPQTRIKLLEATMRNWDDPLITSHDHVVMDMSDKHVLFETSWSGLGSCPWINFRWAKNPGEVWGRGPAYNALSAIKTCNLVVQLILENAEMAITGVWQADDDGVINPANVRLVPGAVIPRSINSRGLEPLSSPGNFDVAQLVLRDMRHNINKALYNETLGRREGTPISATEVSERMAELSRQLGSTYGRLRTEFVDPVIQRVVYLLTRQGLVSLPGLPDGKEIKIIPTSPLSRAQRNEDITQHINFAQVVGQLFGPAAIQTMLDPQKFTEQLAQWYEVSSQLLRDPQAQQMLGQQTGDAAAQMAAQGMDPVESLRAMLP